MRSIVVAVLLLIAAGCSDAMGPSAPRDVAEYDPPEIYFDWWNDVLRDVGLEPGARSMDHLVWYEVQQGEWTDPRHPNPVVGMWSSRGYVYIARGWVLDEGIVKHEMLHEILGPDSNEHWHPLFEIYQAGRMKDGKPINRPWAVR